MSALSPEALKNLKLMAARESDPVLHRLSENYLGIVPPWEARGMTAEEYITSATPELERALAAVQGDGNPIDLPKTMNALSTVLELAGYSLKVKELRNLEALILQAASRNKGTDNEPNT